MTRSLQERLLDSKLYSTIQPRMDVLADESKIGYLFDKLGVYLVHNYRSQKSILHVPSSLFYGGVLVESGNVDRLDSLGDWSELGGASFLRKPLDTVETFSSDDEEEYPSPTSARSPRPFVLQFRGVDGQHDHEVDSPSFFNLEEVQAVVDVCSSLVGSAMDGESAVSTSDIGVIGAFRSQVLKLRIALRAAGLGGINVGSVEDFQGQETRIAVISTVLRHRVPSMEINGTLGLGGDHRRFNVAVTRGMHLVVVVGQPYYLCTDSNWFRLLNYCDKNRSYMGLRCSLLDSEQDKCRNESERLSAAAISSLLGGGALDDGRGVHSMLGGMSAYYSDSLEWRGML